MEKSCVGALCTVFMQPHASDCEKKYLTSYNIQNQLASHIDHKRLRGFVLKLCLLRGGQLYPCGNFVMGGYAACISEMFELLHPYHTSTQNFFFELTLTMTPYTPTKKRIIWHDMKQGIHPISIASNLVLDPSTV